MSESPLESNSYRTHRENTDTNPSSRPVKTGTKLVLGVLVLGFLGLTGWFCFSMYQALTFQSGPEKFREVDNYLTATETW